jgi:carboxyl-terminal processing protease
MRLSFLAAAMLALSAASHAQQSFLTAQQRAADFTAFCDFVRTEYAYFDVKKTDWSTTCAHYASRAAAAADRDAFVGVLERAMAELYDFHAHLGTNTGQSPRLVPTQSQVFGGWRDGKAWVVDVRDGSPAKSAGVHPGMRVLTIDGEPIEAAVARLEPKHLSAPDPSARDWALQLALAGHRDRKMVQLFVAEKGTDREFSFAPAGDTSPDALLSSRMIGDVGYVRFNNSLGDAALVPAFDDALKKLSQARAFVIDLRDTPSGGVSTVARGIIGPFVGTVLPYQRHEYVAEFRSTGIRRIWVEYVAPRLPNYSQRVVVLVGRWTGSMGEGIAIGFNATRDAPILGEPMAHLLGALNQAELPNSKIPVRVPAEKLFHVQGKPREAVVPCSIPGARSSPGDLELDAAMKLARELAARNTKPWTCPT